MNPKLLADIKAEALQAKEDADIIKVKASDYFTSVSEILFKVENEMFDNIALVNNDIKIIVKKITTIRKNIKIESRKSEVAYNQLKAEEKEYIDIDIENEVTNNKDIDIAAGKKVTAFIFIDPNNHTKEENDQFVIATKEKEKTTAARNVSKKKKVVADRRLYNARKANYDLDQTLEKMNDTKWELKEPLEIVMDNIKALVFEKEIKVAEALVINKRLTKQLIKLKLLKKI